eukprot:2716021-Amphidinium_carterae.1
MLGWYSKDYAAHCRRVQLPQLPLAFHVLMPHIDSGQWSLPSRSQPFRGCNTPDYTNGCLTELVWQ